MIRPVNPEAAFWVISRLATKLEQLGYLRPDATYEEFESCMNQFVQTVDGGLERDHMSATPETDRIGFLG